MDTPPPTTPFVPADDRLFAPAVHGSLWLAFGVAAGLAAIALLAWAWRRAPSPGTASAPTPFAVTTRYLAEIDELGRQFADRQFDERELHHRLSTTVRRFAAERGVSGALAMTPRQLGDAGQAAIAGAVATYQPPQFMEWPRCDPQASLDRARVAIAAVDAEAEPC